MADGNLILWKSRASSRIEMAHKGSAVTAMCSLDSGARLASGGKDGSLYIWNSQLVKELELKLPEFSIKSRLPQIQALNYRGGRIIIGTKASEIYEVDIRTPDPNSITTVKLVEGHYVEDAEIWGLASHPKQNIFATASDDKTVRIWDTRTKQPKTVFEIPAKSRALAFR
jgi:microtubule-associated protein-like 6